MSNSLICEKVSTKSSIGGEHECHQTPHDSLMAGANRATQRPRILILMLSAFGIRNIVHSGVLARVLPHTETALLVQSVGPESKALLEQPGVSLHTVEHTQAGPLLRELQSILTMAHSQRYSGRSYRILRSWKRRNLSLWERLRTSRHHVLGTLCSYQPLYGLTRKAVDRLRYSGYDIDFARNLLAEVRPTLLMSTYSVMTDELPYVLAAKEAGIPVVAHILSFDNLTSRGVLPLIHDYFLVWNDRMRDELLLLYPDVRPDQVFITGTPQFDFHMREEFHWSREEVAHRLGLNPDRAWILYAANHHGSTPTEPDLVEQIYKALKSALPENQWQMVVRLHPLDDPHRWESCFGRYPEIRVSLPWDERLYGREDISLLDDQRSLVSILKHAAVCINMTSTMSLDAAVLDTPVIGIAYSAHPGSREDRFYREAYQLEHYLPLVESGGIRLAYNHYELVSAVKTYLAHPEIDRDERRQMIASICGHMDGNAAQRVADWLLSTVAAKRRDTSV